VFPTKFAMAYTRIRPGEVAELSFSQTKEGDMTFQEVVV